MAPKRAKQAAKKRTGGKKRSATGPARIDPPPPRVTQALYDPSAFASEEKVAAIRKMLRKEFIRGDQLEIHPGTSPLQDGEVVTFHDFSVMGMLPPFSDFFMAVLEAFGLHMLHLHPNADMILATFAHACEAFVGVMPSVALFRHFFMPRRGRSR